jgi:hypothetical protein
LKFIQTQTNKSQFDTVTPLKLYFMATGVMATYFTLVMVVFPGAYQDTKAGVPQPSLEVRLSTQQIKLGESFEMTLVATNLGEGADLQTLTVEFPQNQNLDNVKIISYDFLQSPKSFLKDSQVGSDYNGGQDLIHSKYPFIEAYNRPSKPGHSSTMILQITPTEPGPFIVYSKTVAMPHLSEISHFPTQGMLDHQNEFVQEHIIEVIQ